MPGLVATASCLSNQVAHPVKRYGVREDLSRRMSATGVLLVRLTALREPYDTRETYYQSRGSESGTSSLPVRYRLK